MRLSIKEVSDRLSAAKNVDEWNLIRDEIKTHVTTHDLATIESSGLITKVLGKDQPK